MVVLMLKHGLFSGALRGLKLMVLIATGALLICACSNHGFYETARQTRIQECNRLEETQRDKCMAQNEMSYKEYEQERQKVLHANKAQAPTTD